MRSGSLPVLGRRPRVGARELASGVDTLGAPTRERERFHETVEAELVPYSISTETGLSSSGGRPLPSRADAQTRPPRASTASAARAHRRGAPADRARIDTDAAARQEATCAGSTYQATASAASRACSSGVGKELLAERFVKSGEDERERGLGYACRGGKGLRERAELLGLGELRDECVERGTAGPYVGGSYVPCPHRSREARHSNRVSSPPPHALNHHPQGTPVSLRSRYPGARHGGVTASSRFRLSEIQLSETPR